MMTQIPISVCRNSGDHSGAHLKPDYNNARDAEAGDISLNVVVGQKTSTTISIPHAY